MLVETKIILLAKNKAKLKKYIGTLPNLTVAEKSKLFRLASSIDPNNVSYGEMYSLSVLCNKIKSRVHVRIQKQEIKSCRAKQWVFYKCSKHNKCAEDHVNYQGKIYIDRFWKSIIGNNPAVQNYVSTHNIKTIQWVMKGPVWMTTRPYCKHRLVGLDTDTVLSGNTSLIVGKDERRLPTRKKIPIIKLQLEKALGN